MEKQAAEAEAAAAAKQREAAAKIAELTGRLEAAEAAAAGACAFVAHRFERVWACVVSMHGGGVAERVCVCLWASGAQADCGA